MANARVQGLLSSCDFGKWGSGDDVARCSTLAAPGLLRPETPTFLAERPRSRPTSALGKSSEGATGEAMATDGAVAATPVVVGNTLRRMTPEAFLAVLKVDRKFDPTVYSQQNFESQSDIVVLCSQQNSASPPDAVLT